MRTFTFSLSLIAAGLLLAVPVLPGGAGLSAAGTTLMLVGGVGLAFSLLAFAGVHLVIRKRLPIRREHPRPWVTR